VIERTKPPQKRKDSNVTDIREYIELARDMGAFKDIEIDILKETLIAWTERPGDPCSVVELRDGRVLAGFAVFARTQGTDFTWDVRAFCVDSVYRGKGVGQRLADLIEEEILDSTDHGIIRVELSKKKESAVGEGFLLERDFTLIGHIEGFYESNDDYYIYAKHVTIHEPEIMDEPDKGDAASTESKDGAAAETSTT
jgi:GNAT superfamily N-acetyltransferase